MEASPTVEWEGEQVSLERNLAVLLKPKATRSYDVTISYEDINRKKHKSKMQVGKEGIRLLYHE